MIALGQLAKKSRRSNEVDFTDVLKNGLNLDRWIEGRNPLSTYCRGNERLTGEPQEASLDVTVELGEEQTAGWHCRWGG